MPPLSTPLADPGWPSGARQRSVSFEPPRLNVRARELIVPGRMSDPIRSGDTPARPPTQQIFVELRRRAWRAVSREEWPGIRLEASVGAAMPRGRMEPFTERANVRRNFPSSYGSGWHLEGRPKPHPSQLIAMPAPSV